MTLNGDPFKTPRIPLKNSSLRVVQYFMLKTNANHVVDCKFTLSDQTSKGVDNTPVKKQNSKDMALANENNKAKRQDWLCDSLLSNTRRESFDWLIAQLGCNSDFGKFKEQFFALFSAVAYISMTYSDKAINRPHMTAANLTWLETDLEFLASRGTVSEHLDQLNENTLSQSIGKTNESALVEYFGELFNMVTFAIRTLSEDGQWFRNILQYEGSEHQNKSIAGGKHKIDFAIHYKKYCEKDLSSVHISVEVITEARSDNMLHADFGQLADYGRALWKCQPTHQGDASDGCRVTVETNAKTLSNAKTGPEVFDSDIICNNSFGYRVEFLVIQDCGISLADYINRRPSSSIEDRCEIAAKAMLNVTKCLKQAWDYGIFHRDISAGNIAVLKGRATVIDWGYAKLLSDRLTNIDDLAAKWCFEKDQVIDNENAHDPITGTPLYMSIPILVGAEMRSVVDDIESALYAVLDSVYKAQGNKSTPDPIALDYTDSRSLAFKCPDRFIWLVSTLRKFIFVRSDKYIGNHLAMIPGFERTIEDDALEDLLNEMEEQLSNKTNKQLLIEPTGNTARGLKRVKLSNLNLTTPQPRRSKRRINVAGKCSVGPAGASSDASGNCN
ncbi:hypothetical protein COEREDRAFT_97170 [Coemansia reversa NRRL 1564]|uniref:Fungal-type protein kinase domain-containing protein n=1 Tax=Coemansia reversa (strain ATCC 12441 / NRRL 1564) TaxID=763665 RepID=A0A2G5BCZ5_COERN|nr:hypothetical protein COEREDRAFT_97170 [Coemansia reversa NRRL 1564]|eukprot:PIA16894.1 hypothetical protein COEREDRAFT_97170 [Coemansia reversa NRRL 1564]